MSWKDRAEVALADQAPTGWKSRAEPIAAPDGGSDVKGFVSKVARPALEIGGAIGGGAIGAGAGALTVAGVPVGGSMGAALGYAGGKSAADALDVFLGKSKAPASAGEVWTRIGENLLSGAKMETLGVALHPTIKGLASTFLKGGKAVAGPLFGVSDEALQAYLDNPASIKGATMEKLAQKLPQVADKFNKVIEHFSSQADDTLSTSKYLLPGNGDPGGAFTKDEVLKTLTKARKGLGGLYTDEARQAGATLGRITDALQAKRNTVSQNEVKDLITNLDNEIPWTKVWKTPENLTAADNALIRVRTSLDSILKNKNPAYAEAMKPVSDALDARNQFLKKFGVDKVKGAGYQASDMTVGKLRNAMNEGKLGTGQALDRTQAITGENVGSDVNNALYNKEFFGERTTRPLILDLLTMLGAGGGAGLGGGSGAVLGALTGKMTGNSLEKYGGVAGSKVLDLLASTAKNGPVPLNVLSDPILRRLIASQGVSAAGNSGLQIQDILNLLRGNQYAR